ncbi:MAG TPA: tRNA-dihydrouridine synthase family protein [Candidatus Dorea intestinavium]|nr:tRNA-dihydrouridine synthase family protein [Candidatus Dorea intestinavium]
MQYYLAPLEGITTSIYRNLYHQYFTPMDKYFTPFLVPHTKKSLANKEKRKVAPEFNQGLYLVPQILTNNAQGFLSTVEKLKPYGYQEVNLNLGCPSKTVTGKGRGAGFLKEPEKLEQFLEEIYAKCDVEISIKTRIGIEEEEEFLRLLEIYHKFPLKELIIHPRTLKDFYGNEIHFNAYQKALLDSPFPVCFNGDIRTKKDTEKINENYPTTNAIMLGRGIVGKPDLLQEIKEDEAKKEQTLDFMKALKEGYFNLTNSEKQTLFKLKEICGYMSWFHEEDKKIFKKMMKTNSLENFFILLEEVF